LRAEKEGRSRFAFVCADGDGRKSKQCGPRKARERHGTSAHLHVPAALVTFCALGLLVVKVEVAVGLPSLVRVELKLRLAPGTRVQVLLVQLHIPFGSLCTPHCTITLAKW
jgi:hypothetical protein